MTRSYFFYRKNSSQLCGYRTFLLFIIFINIILLFCLCVYHYAYECMYIKLGFFCLFVLCMCKYALITWPEKEKFLELLYFHHMEPGLRTQPSGLPAGLYLLSQVFICEAHFTCEPEFSFHSLVPTVSVSRSDGNHMYSSLRKS